MTIVDDGTNTFNGGSALNIGAPLAADYGIPGIVIAGSRTDTSGNSLTFNGGTTPTFAGVIYFPHANVNFSGAVSSTI
jgi:hypothetical protein